MEKVFAMNDSADHWQSVSGRELPTESYVKSNE
jgi:hypothetical protein